MANISLPDGKILETTEGSTLYDAVMQIGAGLAKAAVAAKFNGKLVDLSTAVVGDGALEVITSRDELGLEIMRHSCAHIMAEAILSIWSDAKLVYGPTVKDGFYYDIDLDTAITPDDFEKIEKKMEDIVKADKDRKSVV